MYENFGANKERPSMYMYSSIRRGVTHNYRVYENFGANNIFNKERPSMYLSILNIEACVETVKQNGKVE